VPFGRIVPGRPLLLACAAGAVVALIALLLGAGVAATSVFAAAWAVVLIVMTWADAVVSRRLWRESPARMTRRLPDAFAIGVRRTITLAIELEGRRAWRGALYDYADSTLVCAGLPIAVELSPGRSAEVTYTVVPTRRGNAVLAPADLRLRSRLGFCELRERLGAEEVRRVYPDFAQIARYAWLAGDKRLQEIGIKTYQQRGEGTDFKQLAEYRHGDPVRHVDWKATQRLGKPIVREFQEERDQCILLLLDCGRRMRADERQIALGGAHFDQVLNAVMLLTHVALRHGDAVGALTFGSPPGAERSFAPRKGMQTLNALMGELYDVQPTPTHSDYLGAAQGLLARHTKRALVIVITNFRDEDSSELGHALRLLRSRHLVLLASLRERIVDEIAAQPLVSAEAAIDVASAHLYEQARRDAFARLAARDGLMIDAEPERLGVSLVNRYQAMKRAGMI
jgi:uncharacterized protein (DUF58 family)